jgi:iron complex transport system ATP-binding protein
MSEIIGLNEATVVRGGKRILGPISLSIHENERWVILGPNGAGKTTFFHLAAANMHPTSGTVRVLGETLGKVDVFELRPRIGFTTNAVIDQVPIDEKVMDVVMTSAYAIYGRWQEEYDLWDESRALSLLTTLGVRDLAARDFGTLSDGERKRCMIARALMPNPELLLLDEPAAGLDLGGREDLLKRLELLAQNPMAPATVIVTHHIEEIPIGTTHALLLNQGEIVASGEIRTVITEENLTSAYGLPISVTIENGRFFARAI